MNYIIFKTDGSVLKQNIEYYVQQGNSGDEIFVGYQGALLTDGTIALFTLPNAEQTQNTVAGVPATKEIEIEGALVEVPGWTITLTRNQTLYYGLLMVAIRIARDNSVIVSYPFYLVINETGVRPDSDTGVTIEEINSYLLQLQAIARGCIRFYNLNQNTATIGDIEDTAGLDVQFAMIFNNCLSICSLSKDINNKYTLTISNPYGIFVKDNLVRTDGINNLSWSIIQTLNNNCVVVTNPSGTLTPEQIKQIQLDNCYIKHTGWTSPRYFRLVEKNATDAYFQWLQITIGSDHINCNAISINVNLTTGYYELNFQNHEYYTSAQVNSLLSTKQDKLVAGENITIVGNVISSSGGITVPTFDAHFEGEPEFEDFQLTQEDLNDIWANKYPLINIRVTIENGLATTYYIICFKLSHNVDGDAMTYAMTSMEFSNDDGHQYDLDCMSFVIALDEDLPYIAAVNEEYYTNDYRKLENKPNIPQIDTTIGAESLDDRVPSSKCVYDNIQNVREVAEGKCVTVVLDYEQTIADLKEAISQNENVTVCDLDKNDITQDIVDGDYDNVQVVNSSFNSNSNDIFLLAQTNNNDNYIIFTTDGFLYNFIVAKVSDLYNKDFIKSGDIFLIAQTDIPDRWVRIIRSDVGMIGFSKLETSKVDLSGYVTLDTAQRITAPKSFYNNSANNTLPLRIQGFDNHTWGLEMDKDFGRLHFKYADTSGTNISNVSDQLVLDFSSLFPATNGGKDLGTSSYTWKDFYLTGAIKFSRSDTPTTWSIQEISGGTLQLYRDNLGKMLFTSTYFQTYSHIPTQSNTYDLGNSSFAWRNLYLSGNLTDGTNSISVADIVAGSGGNVSDLYLELASEEPTQAQLEQVYTQKPDVLRIGMGSDDNVVVLYKSAQREDETRLYYFNIQTSEGVVQVLKIEYSEEDGYIVENYEWTLDSIVSGTNNGTNWTSLTINGETYAIPQGGGSSTDVQVNGTSITSNGVANIITTTAYDAANNHMATMSDIPDVSTKQETLVSGQNIKTINGTSLLGSGDITISSVGVDKFLSNAQLVSGSSSTTEETVTFSALDTANANFALLSNNRSFWTTYDDYMAAITGSKLEEITLNVGQAGNIRIYGYDTAIPYSQTNNQLASAAANADTNGYLIMTIAAELGISTYKLDGTDSRVTISSQTAIDSCPPCLGFSRTGDTGLMKYNANNITGEPYRHWAHAGLSGNTIETPDPTNALPIVFKILKTSTDPNAKLVFTMNDNTTYEVTLGSVNIAPVLSSVYKGKKLSILGDSISTYQNQIPSGNPTYYPRGDVNSPDKTWWKKLADALEMSILVNNSWSGSMVTTNNGDAGAGCLTRCQSLHSGSTDPDVIIVWLGINDFNNEVALGTYDGKSAVPNTTTTFREAYGMMLNKILTRYKTSEVWVCTLPQMERNNNAGFPEINENGVPLKDYNDAIVELADAFGVKVLDHNKAGMTYQNMDIYTVDWDSSTSKGLHPNDAGHSLIANNDIRQLDNVVRKRY